MSESTINIPVGYFILSNIEEKNFVKFRNAQKQKYGTEGVSGTFTFAFTQTAIGIVVEAINNVTKDKKDITDYDMW